MFQSALLNPPRPAAALTPAGLGSDSVAETETHPPVPSHYFLFLLTSYRFGRSHIQTTASLLTRELQGGGWISWEGETSALASGNAAGVGLQRLVQLYLFFWRRTFASGAPD